MVSEPQGVRQLFSSASNNRGNSVIIAVVAGALSLAGLALILNQVSQFSQQVSQSEKTANQSGQDAVSLYYIQKKFTFGKTVIPATQSEPESFKYKAPDWYPEFYPTASELNTTPRIIPVKPVGSGAFPSPLVPLLMVTKNKVASGECKPLDFPVPKSQINSNEDCEFISLSPDKSSLGAIQGQTELHKTNNFQLSLIAVPDANLLTASQKDALFKPGFEYPLAATRLEPIKFVKYVINESNPKVFSKIAIQTNSIGAIIPVEIPPAPKCRLSLHSSVQQPLVLSSDRLVKLSLEVEQGIAESVSISLANERETLFNSQQFDRQHLNNFERLTPLKADGFDINILTTDKNNIARFNRSSDGNNRIWNIIANVKGLDSTSKECSTSIMIHDPPTTTTTTTTSTLAPSVVINPIPDTVVPPTPVITVVPPTPPPIAPNRLMAVTQPVNQSTREGDDRKNYYTLPTFNFVAQNSGGLPITYKWYRKNRTGTAWIEVALGSQSALKLNSVRILQDHGALFKCKASAPNLGDLWSNEVTLTVTGGWVNAAGGGCADVCERHGFVPKNSPEGANCASGETIPWSAWDSKANNQNPIDFNWGCWDGCVGGKGCHTNRCAQARSEPSIPNKKWGYCYAPAQTRDNDNTDITAACYCGPR